MKSYENFDNTFFVKIICIIAALALVFVIAAVAVGLFTKNDSPASEDSGAETFVFDDSSKESEPISPDTNDDTELPTPPDNSDSETETDAPESDSGTEPLQSERGTDITDEPAPTVLEATEDMGEEYISSLTFLGDSTTYGLKTYEMLKDGKETKQLWAAENATLTLSDILTKKIIYPESGDQMTIAEAAALAKPEYLVITLGVEGLLKIEEEDFKSEYTSLIEAIQTTSHDTKIIIQSIFPAASDFKTTNAQIDIANAWVREVAENTGVRYLDTQSVLKNESGDLDPKYDNGGTGISLNDTGFAVVLEYIRTHGYR